MNSDLVEEVLCDWPDPSGFVLVQASVLSEEHQLYNQRMSVPVWISVRRLGVPCYTIDRYIHGIHMCYVSDRLIDATIVAGLDEAKRLCSEVLFGLYVIYPVYSSSVHTGIRMEDLLRMKGPVVFSPHHRFNTIPKELEPYV